MIRNLTLAVLIINVFEISLSSFVLSTWLKISRRRVLKPAFALLALTFLGLGFWNFLKGNYLLSTTASLFFMVSLTLFMVGPLSETWKICKG